jgi:hypothetical protein
MATTHPAPIGFVHNIVWGAETLEHMTRLMFDAAADPLDIDDYLCRTIDGHVVRPDGTRIE